MGSKLRFPDEKSLQCGTGALGCRAEQQDPAEGVWEAKGCPPPLSFPGHEEAEQPHQARRRQPLCSLPPSQHLAEGLLLQQCGRECRSGTPSARHWVGLSRL